jgi:predicted dinucleotide-binding enzyme
MSRSTHDVRHDHVIVVVHRDVESDVCALLARWAVAVFLVHSSRAHCIVVRGSGLVNDNTMLPELPDVSQLTVGVLGGTGEQGRGLAHRLARAGQRVIIGSRDGDRAQGVAADMGDGVLGSSNEQCARDSDIVIVAVPWDGHADLLQSLREPLSGKIVVDCVLLLDDSVGEINTDVLVLGDDREATDAVQALAARIPGIRGIYGGRLRNAGQVEAMTANLISMNRRYKAHAGLRVTDV